MSSPRPAQATEVKTTQLPAWVDQGGQENYQLAKSVANRPLEQFQGQTVADPSQFTTQAYGLSGRLGDANAYTGEAADLYRRSAGDLDINKFLNPYRGEVEQNAIRAANEAQQRGLLAVDDRARAARAFGGSRAAVERGVLGAEGTKGIGDLSAKLRQSGFDTASNLALADRAKYTPAAAGLLATGQQQQQTLMQQIQQLLGFGAQDQSQQQKLLDAQQKKFYEARDYPVEQLNLRLAALGMTPYGKTETGTKTSTQEVLQPDWASILLGGAKVGASLYSSDRKDKTDIKKLGSDPLSGTPIYSYRYKDDPKTYPKVVGPMAQDIEKKFPSAVKKVGKHKVVDINNLMEVLS